MPNIIKQMQSKAWVAAIKKETGMKTLYAISKEIGNDAKTGEPILSYDLLKKISRGERSPGNHLYIFPSCTPVFKVGPHNVPVWDALLDEKFGYLPHSPIIECNKQQAWLELMYIFLDWKTLRRLRLSEEIKERFDTVDLVSTQPSNLTLAALSKLDAMGELDELNINKHDFYHLINLICFGYNPKKILNLND